MNKELYVNQEIEKGLSPRNSRLLKRAVGVLEKNKYFEISSFFGGRTMISPGVRGFRGVWNWDSAFHAVGVSHFDAKLAIDQIEGFLDYIMEDGMLPDLIEKGGTPQIHSSKPPVFAWAAYEVYKNTGESDFLRRIYNKLVLNAVGIEGNTDSVKSVSQGVPKGEYVTQGTQITVEFKDTSAFEENNTSQNQ